MVAVYAFTSNVVLDLIFKKSRITSFCVHLWNRLDDLVCQPQPRHLHSHSPRLAAFSFWEHHVIVVFEICCFFRFILFWFFGRPFVKRFALYYRTVLCPVCDVGVLWPNGWMDQDATWCGCRTRPRRHCVRWRPSSPQKRHSSPALFGPCLLWPNVRPFQQQLLSYCRLWWSLFATQAVQHSIIQCKAT